MQKLRLLVTLHIARLIALHHPQQVRRPRSHIVQNRRRFIQSELLRQIPHPQPLPSRHRPPIRLIIPSQDPHQAALPPAIATHQPQLLPLMQSHRRLVKNHLQPKLQAQAID